MLPINDPSIKFGFDIAVQGFNARDFSRLNRLTSDRFSNNPRRWKAARVPHYAALMGLCAILTYELPRAGCTFDAPPIGALELNYQNSLGEEAYQAATQQLLTSINCAMRALPGDFRVASDLFDILQAAATQDPPKKDEAPTVQKVEIVAQPALAISSMPTRKTETLIDRDATGDMSGSRATEADAV